MRGVIIVSIVVSERTERASERAHTTTTNERKKKENSEKRAKFVWVPCYFFFRSCVCLLSRSSFWLAWVVVCFILSALIVHACVVGRFHFCVDFRFCFECILTRGMHLLSRHHPTHRPAPRQEERGPLCVVVVLVFVPLSVVSVCGVFSLCLFSVRPCCCRSPLLLKCLRCVLLLLLLVRFDFSPLSFLSSIVRAPRRRREEDGEKRQTPPSSSSSSSLLSPVSLRCFKTLARVSCSLSLTSEYVDRL